MDTLTGNVDDPTPAALAAATPTRSDSAAASPEGPTAEVAGLNPQAQPFTPSVNPLGVLLPAAVQHEGRLRNLGLFRRLPLEIRREIYRPMVKSSGMVILAKEADLWCFGPVKDAKTSRTEIFGDKRMVEVQAPRKMLEIFVAMQTDTSRSRRILFTENNSVLESVPDHNDLVLKASQSKDGEGNGDSEIKTEDNQIRNGEAPYDDAASIHVTVDKLSYADLKWQKNNYTQNMNGRREITGMEYEHGAARRRRRPSQVRYRTYNLATSTSLSTFSTMTTVLSKANRDSCFRTALRHRTPGRSPDDATYYVVFSVVAILNDAAALDRDPVSNLRILGSV